MKMKDGTKVHTGEVVGFGTKAEIEKLMLDLEGQQDDDEEEAATEGEQGTCMFKLHAFICIQVRLLNFIVYFFSTRLYRWRKRSCGNSTED